MPPLALSLDFYGFRCTVHSTAKELLSRLSKDFSSFAVLPQALNVSSHLELKALDSAPPFERIPKHARGRHSKNCVIYTEGKIRYNNYQNRALCIFDYEHNKAEIYSPSPHLLHEVAYLTILSRTGKWLDRQGLHRIHACGLQLNSSAILGLAPSQGGKTTFFLHALSHARTEIISDDSPLSSVGGKITAFPLRLGIKPESYETYAKLGVFDGTQTYTLERMHYGPKHLVPVTALKNPVSTRAPSNLILLQLRKAKHPEPRLRLISTLRLAPELFSGLVIGYGLPMLRELYIEPGWKDLLTVGRIFFSRLQTFFRILFRATAYSLDWDGKSSCLPLLEKELKI